MLWQCQDRRVAGGVHAFPQDLEARKWAGPSGPGVLLKQSKTAPTPRVPWYKVIARFGQVTEQLSLEYEKVGCSRQEMEGLAR